LYTGVVSDTIFFQCVEELGEDALDVISVHDVLKSTDQELPGVQTFPDEMVPLKIASSCSNPAYALPPVAFLTRPEECACGQSSSSNMVLRLYPFVPARKDVEPVFCLGGGGIWGLPMPRARLDKVLLGVTHRAQCVQH
jgi:hypothetical protein